MQIVVNISKELYETILNLPDFISATATQAIRDGIPLPKGHGTLKDVDHYRKMQWEHPDYSLMDDEPTIIEADKEQE